jgi:glycosyltransferase involved in cell wall biosynthesis
MISHSFYESDNRVLRYAESLAARGDDVEILALRRTAEQPVEETINGVKLFRIQDRFGKTEKSKTSFLRPLLRFLLLASWWVMRRHWKRRFDLLHVHNIPDFLVFAAWYPKLMGAKIILDIHDIVPEFFASKFGGRGNSKLIFALKLAEKISAKFADHVIIANDLWLEKYTARSAPVEKCSVFINNVDSKVFHPLTVTKTLGKRVVIFPGGLQWHQGLDIAIRAFAKVHPRLTDTEFHIYGDGDMKPKLVDLVSELELDQSVRFFKPMPIRDIARVMAAADLGVVPKRADSFGNEAYSTKIMEFMSVGVPVIISNTRIDRFYFNDSVVRFFESGNVDALAAGMVELLENQSLRKSLIANANDYVLKNSWENRKQDYLRLVDSLCA